MLKGESYVLGLYVTEELQAEHHTRKVKETHELIFSWSPRLAILLVGTHDDDGDSRVAQHGGPTAA